MIKSYKTSENIRIDQNGSKSYVEFQRQYDMWLYLARAESNAKVLKSLKFNKFILDQVVITVCEIKQWKEKLFKYSFDSYRN